MHTYFTKRNAISPKNISKLVTHMNLNHTCALDSGKVKLMNGSVAVKTKPTHKDHPQQFNLCK